MALVGVKPCLVSELNSQRERLNVVCTRSKTQAWWHSCTCSYLHSLKPVAQPQSRGWQQGSPSLANDAVHDCYHHLTCTSCVQAQAAALRQVGRGGLNEQAGSSHQGPQGLGEGSSGGQRGEASAVSTVEIVRHPSESEQVLRILAAQLRALKHLSPQTG